MTTLEEPQATTLDGQCVIGRIDRIEVRGRSESFIGFHTAIVTHTRGTSRVELAPDLRTAAGDVPLPAFDKLMASTALGKHWCISVGFEPNDYIDKNGVARKATRMLAIDAYEL